MEEEKKVKNTNENYISAVGRRKSAVARVRLYKKVKDNLMIGEILVKKGDMVVNGKGISEYFKSPVFKSVYEEPFKTLDVLNKFAVTAVIRGGGSRSQLGAFVLGVARAFSIMDESNRTKLRSKGLLTRDQRARERRKVGTGGKARRTKQSPKR